MKIIKIIKMILSWDFDTESVFFSWGVHSL